MSSCQRIWIEAIGLGGRGQRYRVTHQGATLIESTRNPEFDSARALLAQGIVGEVEVWRHGAISPAMRFNVENAAKLTIEEGDRTGPRFVPWHARSEEANGYVVFTSGGYARTAGDEAPAPPPEKIGRSWPLPATKFESGSWSLSGGEGLRMRTRRYRPSWRRCHRRASYLPAQLCLSLLPPGGTTAVLSPQCARARVRPGECSETRPVAMQPGSGRRG